MSNSLVMSEAALPGEETREKSLTRPDAKKRQTSLARQLAQSQAALLAARERVDVEVHRRTVAEQELDRRMLAERERVRKQLHDGLGQLLTSVSFLASSLRARLNTCGIRDAAELDEMQRLVNQAIAESKTIAAGCDENPRARYPEPG